MRKKYIIAVDLGATNLKLAILNNRYIIKKKQVFCAQSLSRANKLIPALISRIKSLLKEARLTNKDISGLGLGLPGSIDAEKGKVHFLPNIAG